MQLTGLDDLLLNRISNADFIPAKISVPPPADNRLISLSKILIT
jgi:hypothetical protein